MTLTHLRVQVTSVVFHIIFGSTVQSATNVLKETFVKIVPHYFLKPCRKLKRVNVGKHYIIGAW